MPMMHAQLKDDSVDLDFIDQEGRVMIRLDLVKLLRRQIVTGSLDLAQNKSASGECTENKKHTITKGFAEEILDRYIYLKILGNKSPKRNHKDCLFQGTASHQCSTVLCAHPSKSSKTPSRQTRTEWPPNENWPR